MRGGPHPHLPHATRSEPSAGWSWRLRPPPACEPNRAASGSTRMDGQIYLIIAGTFFGFIALAFVLLYPVYRFMRRQETMADDWTPEAVARRTRRRPPPDDEPG